MRNLAPWMRWGMAIGVSFLGLGLLVNLIDRWVQLHRTLALISPWLAGVVSLGLALTIGAGLGWVLWRILLPKQRLIHPTVKVSANKTAAAAENLTALEQQVQQIQDQVTREALLNRSTTLRQNIDRQEPQIVVFGVGSAGKTSLVNALLSQEKGAVAATMGTTTLGTKYRPVRIPGIAHPFSLIDCPGILEAGVAGTDREQKARKLASQADLILFVVDDDLRHSEFQVLQELGALGKKLVVVLNKIDRWTTADREKIEQRIQGRMNSFSLPPIVVAIAAHPPMISLPSGESVQPSPKLGPLIQALQSIFAQEGADLIADNVLLQCQTLGETARSMLTAQRETAAQQIVDRYQWIVAGAVAATPLPLVDLLAAAAVNTQMVMELSQVYDCSLTLEDSKTLVASLTQTLTGVGITRGALHVISSALTITPVGMVLRSAIAAVTAAYLTRIAGKSFQTYFQQQQQWGDGGIAAVVTNQFDLQQREGLLRLFIQETLHHVMRTPPQEESR